MTVLVLRDDRGDPLVARLAALGIAAERVSPVRFEPLPHIAPDAVDWLIVTSATTVAMVGRWPRARRVAAVGPATARALRDAGVQVDVVPGVASGAGLAAELPSAPGETAWLPRSDLATDELPTLLGDKGLDVTATHVYATLVEPVDPGDHALIVAYSPSGVRALPDDCRVPVVAVGAPTAREVLDRGFVLAGIADEPTDRKMSEAITSVLHMEET